MKYLTMAAVLMFGLAACEDDPMKIDDEAPEVSIVYPEANASYEAGDTLRMQFTVHDNDELHTVVYTIRNLNTQEDVYESMTHEHANQLSHTDYWVLPASGTYTHYELRVVASDHLENKSESKVLFDFVP